MGEHIKTGFNSYEFRCYVYYKDYEKYMKYMVNNKIKFYVYTVYAPIDTNFNIGNNNIQPEYTYDGELKIEKRDTYTFNEEIYQQVFNPCNDDKYEELMQFKAENIRGPLGLLFYPSWEVLKKWKYVYKAVRAGNINPGDDLDSIMNEYQKTLTESYDSIDDFLFESFDFDWDFVDESTKKNKKKKITKADIEKAKQEAFNKIIRSQQYMSVSRGMSYSERMELQAQIRNRINDNVSDANDFFSKYPYASFFVCTLVAIGGTAYVAKMAISAIPDIVHMGSDAVNYLDDSISTFFSNNQDILSNQSVAGDHLDLIDLDLDDSYILSDAIT